LRAERMLLRSASEGLAYSHFPLLAVYW